MRQIVSLTLLAMILGCLGCTHLQPHRTIVPKGELLDCLPNEYGKVQSGCSALMTETVNGSYKLHFVEFDDQGRPYTEHPKRGEAHRQLGRFLEEVEQDSKDKKVSVVVFVHGWLHSAQTDDENLRSFRVLLSQLAKVESDGPCGRSLVGLYVGWRGAGTRMGTHPWETPTFWSRKLAAEHIAHGSFQQVLAGLKAVQQKAVDDPVPERVLPGKADCSSGVKTTYVGHSFGGLIVMTSLTQDFSRSLMVDRANMRTRIANGSPSEKPLDELAIVINPAVESARFDALYRVASETHYPTYRAPRFISITSVNDWPTRTMFPLGRVLNTSTKRYPEGDKNGRAAARKTIGHDENYLTHRLAIANPPLSQQVIEQGKQCAAWHAAQNSYTTLGRIETDATAKFHASNGGSYDATQPQFWPRYFCSQLNSSDPQGLLLLQRLPTAGPDANSPIWNITTSKPILDSHTDITNIKLLEFLRQIYIETMFFK